MNVQVSPAMRGLIWKEARQLLPLIWMLLGVSGMLSLVMAFAPINGIHEGVLGALVPFVLPAFMAAGAGAILVGQEKETGTLHWTSSLPISPKDVYWSKIIVSLAGLVVMWCGCIVLFSVLGLDRRTGFFQAVLNEPLWLSLLFWILHTVYVLWCGHYTAWRCDNPLTSLLLMLPIAATPYFVASIFERIRIGIVGGYLNNSATMNATFAFTVPALMIVGWLSYAAMRRKLNPTAPPVLGSDLSPSFEAWRPPSDSTPTPRPFRSPIASLFWQSVRQNPRVMLALSLMVLVGFCALPLAGPSYLMGGFSLPHVIMLAAGFFGVSWLGVVAFAGDGSHNRMKFLADRGVSPTTIWLGRHGIGMTVCAAGLLLFAVMQFQFFDSDWWRWIRELGIETPSLLAVTLVVFAIYATSQWVSQVLRIVAGTVFLAPFLSVLMVGWLVSLPAFWGANSIIIGICLTIPLGMTCWMMNDHIDGRRGLRFWTLHSTGLLLIFALPIGNTLTVMARMPSVSKHRRTEILKMASSYPEPARPRNLMRVERSKPVDTVPYYSRNNTFLSGQQVEEILSGNGQRPQDWLQFNPQDSAPLTISGFESDLIPTTEFHVRKCWAAAESGDSPDQESVEMMKQWLTGLTQFTRRFRASAHWVDQEAADGLEIYLTRTLSHPSMRPWLEQAFCRDAIELVSDFDARVEARRRAVLISWKNSLKPKEGRRSNSTMGGYDADEWVPITTPTVLMSTAHDRIRDAVAEQALAMIDAGASGQSTLPFRKALHRLVNGDMVPFEVGAYSDRFRATASPDETRNIDYMDPAQHWFAPWEDVARQLTMRRAPTLSPGIQSETNDE